MVKQSVFCKQLHFYANYYNISGWESLIHLTEPIQDGMEIMQQIMQRIKVHEEKTGANLFSSDIKSMCIVVSSFVDDKTLQYSLFSNKIQKDLLRKTVYKIKDKFGKNSVRKASEIIETGIMKDAIGFGSVKDLYDLNPAEEGKNYFNQYLLEDDNEME
ncbi:MAG: hypothetical protein PW786_03300 [Arachidicoccus sp.]|nr:hypothetical protein [Arachidicoccus sp.]